MAALSILNELGQAKFVWLRGSLPIIKMGTRHCPSAYFVSRPTNEVGQFSCPVGQLTVQLVDWLVS